MFLENDLDKFNLCHDEFRGFGVCPMTAANGLVVGRPRVGAGFS